jgi:hypothetical protein
LTVEDVLKTAPAVVGAVVALIRVLPSIAAARRRRRLGGRTGQYIHVTRYTAPLPWSASLNQRVTSETRDPKLRRKAIRVVAFFGLLTLAIEYVYLDLASSLSLPGWSVALSIGATLAIVSTIVTTLIRLIRSEDQLTYKVPQRGSVVIEGRPIEEVAQRALSLLVGIGARVVSFDGSTVHAATGVQLATRLFIGEYLRVRIKQDDGSTVAVIAESVKLDYVTPSRSRRNVLEFLEAWLPYEELSGEKSSQPDDSTASEGVGHGDPD